MKKFYLLAIVGVLLSSYACAQDSLKASWGNVTLELNLNPFNGDLSLNNALNQVKLRYFTGDDFALRLGFNVNSNTSDISITNAFGTSPYTLQQDKKTYLLGVNLGVEKHFYGTRRLSPYIGIEAAFAYRKSQQTDNDGQTETVIDGALREATLTNNSFTYTYYDQGYISYGVNVIAGFDFYVARHLFIGYEIAYQFYSQEYTDIDIRTTGSTFPVNSPDDKQKDFVIRPYLINGIRIGYAFNPTRANV